MNKNNSIALCMIVKNESHVIYDTLVNLCDNLTFDYFVISDTGSTDNTKEIITDFFKSKNIPGEIHDDEWVDFGHNRSLALEYAFSCPSRFLFMFDADDRINGKLELPLLEPMCNDVKPTQFSLIFGTGFTYTRPLIFDNNFKWKFVGVLHEFADTVEEREKETKIVNGSYWVDSRREGSRNKDPLKYQKDAEILNKAYHKEVETGGKLGPRYAFYCAQSYKDCNELEKSIEWYLKRATMGNYQEEVYLSYLYAGRCMMQLDKPESEIEDTLLKGWESMRCRSECLYYLAFYLRNKSKFSKAYVYASLGTKIPYPHQCQLFVERDIFEVKIFDECAISSFYTQRFEECYKLNAKLLQKVQDERIWKNMEFCVPHLKERAISKAFYNFNKPQTRYYGVTLTMTSCKRYDLFEQTVNSLLHNVKDLYMVERFICIDDNSSKEDRKKMLENYPFIEFVFKRTDQKGHVFSMNMIRKKLTPEDKYIFHLEDDWVFLTRRNYIGNSIRLLKDNNGIGQVLFNRNYAELVKDYAIEGGQVVAGGKYRIHEHQMPPKYKISCEYWAHFSFRPSIIRREVFDRVGAFNEVKHFEMDYAQRYTKLGYKSCFHNRIDLIHIGKLTSEKGENAYTLNGVQQF